MAFATNKIVACETCGLVQQVAGVTPGTKVECARCHSKLFSRIPYSRVRTLTFSLAALILYFPSNIYPLITAEYHGMHSETTVFQGIRALFTHGQYFIAVLVFCTSLLSPAFKILALIFIPLTLDWPRFKSARTWTYKFIRVIDPWNMLEVFLLAIGLSMVEMGRMATVHPGRGLFSFAAVVVLTLLATLSFDSRLLWDSKAEKIANHE